jgi:hypothetical protein
VAPGVLDLAIPEVLLGSPRVLPAIGQFVAASHVATCADGSETRFSPPGPARGTDLSHRIRRCFAFTHEYIGGVRILAPPHNVYEALELARADLRKE